MTDNNLEMVGKVVDCARIYFFGTEIARRVALPDLLKIIFVYRNAPMHATDGRSVMRAIQGKKRAFRKIRQIFSRQIIAATT